MWMGGFVIYNHKNLLNFVQCYELDHSVREIKSWNSQESCPLGCLLYDAVLIRCSKSGMRLCAKEKWHKFRYKLFLVIDIIPLNLIDCIKITSIIDVIKLILKLLVKITLAFLIYKTKTLEHKDKCGIIPMTSNNRSRYKNWKHP